MNITADPVTLSTHRGAGGRMIRGSSTVPDPDGTTEGGVLVAGKKIDPQEPSKKESSDSKAAAGVTKKTMRKRAMRKRAMRKRAI